jgi:hypothetical protein
MLLSVGGMRHNSYIKRLSMTQKFKEKKLKIALFYASEEGRLLSMPPTGFEPVSSDRKSGMLDRSTLQGRTCILEFEGYLKTFCFVSL